MKKTLKKILIIASVIFGILLSAAIILPVIYKDKIKAMVMEDINKNLDAFVTVGDIDLTLISTFPYLGVKFKDISIFGKKEFASVPLFSTKQLSLGLNLMSVIKGEKPMTIRSISLDRPLINVQILADGKANYNISKDTSASSGMDDFRLLLKKYAINNGTIVYKDKSTGIFTDFRGVNHHGSGDFGSSLFDLSTSTVIDSTTVINGNMTLLKNASLSYDATLKADMLNNKFTFKENKLKINDTELKADGWVRLNEKYNEMDLKFSSPNNSFKNFLSLIPGAYTSDFKDVKTEGSFRFDGSIKGKLSDTSIPSFDINIKVANAMVKYPTLPKSIKNINTSISLINKGDQPDQTVVNINPLNLTIDSNPFELALLLKTPVSDPDIDAKFKGTLNLADLAQAFPMKDINGLKGILVTDVKVKARNSDIEQKRYEKVNVSGNVIAKGFTVLYSPYPPVKIDRANIGFSPQNISISNLSGKLGNSDVQASGKIDNFMAYFSPKLTMKGDFNLKSTFFNANEWLKAMEKADKTTNAGKEPDGSKANQEVFDRFDFALNANIGKLLFNEYELNNIITDGWMTPNKLQLRKLSFVMGQSDFSASGSVNNIFNWLFKNQNLGGDIVFSSHNLDMNQFMQADPKAKTTTATEPLIIPANIQMNIKTDIGKLSYTNMTLNNVSGTLLVADQAVKIIGGTANTLGGKVNISGGYNSKDSSKPGFDIKLGLEKIGFTDAFNTFNTIKKLAPIAQYITGAFNTELSMSGSLTKDMSPDLNTLQADGFLETLSGVIKNFKPLNDVGNKLNIKEFNNFELRNTKNWITIKNGAVEVKDFDYSFKNIAMQIGGKHGLNQDMDYKIKAKIPRKMLESNTVGAAAYSGIGFLSKEASKYGVNISAGEFVNVLIGIGGSMLSPKLNFKILGTEGASVKNQVSETVGSAITNVKDSINRRAQQEVQKVKDKAKAEADRMADSLAKVANQKADEAIRKAQEELQNKIGKEVSDKVGDKVGDKAKSEIEKAKDKLKKYDPFKKK
ncbi:MAG TPA: AsmA-like C-terminal region-containing protein [Saprospiraceae bacterium]|nr:AsmA-like C-terminal region-containing protein [Saprospiraceae bacterium]